ncbi:MAG: ABC transporter permease [Bacillota bacterium]|nr:ABC transporter permease [Bacillota bacterium]
MRERAIVTRSVLSMAGFVASVMLFLAIMVGSYNYGQRYSGMGKTLVTLPNEFRDSSGTKHYLDYEEMLEIVGKLDNLSTTMMTYSVSGAHEAILSPQQASATAWAMGVSTGFDKFSGFTMKEGRFLQQIDEEREVCVISERLARKLQVRVSDFVTYAGRELEVVGIVAERLPFDVSYVVPTGIIYVPVALKRQLSVAALNIPLHLKADSDLRPHIRAYLVYRPGARDALREELKEALRNRYGHDHVSLIGVETTAFGYLRFIVAAWGLGLLVIGFLALSISVRSVTTLLLLAQHGGFTSPLSRIGPGAAVSAIVGGVAGAGLQRLLLGTSDLNIVFFALAGIIGVGLPVFIAETRKESTFSN